MPKEARADLPKMRFGKVLQVFDGRQRQRCSGHRVRALR